MATSTVKLNGTTLMTVNDTTAVAADVVQGKVFTAVDGTKTTGTASSGAAPQKQVNFIDYDGTILYSYTAQEANALTALPANPSHSGLTAQGWNWTLQEIKAQLTALPDGPIWVGQMYITQSGDTEINVRFADAARLSPILTIAVNGTITVDWGDNTTSSTVTGSSLTTRQAPSHTYAAPGEYTIVIHVVSGSFTFYGSSIYTLLRKNTSSNENRVYSNCVQAVRLGSGITSIEQNAFYCCRNLKYVTIPSTVTSVGNYICGECYSIASISIPSTVTSIGTNAFQYCYCLTLISIPSTVTSIGTYAFSYCYSLASITIPSGVTSIGNFAFQTCYNIASITIPSTVTSIGNQMFTSCYCLTSIKIPNGVTSIETYAIASCISLASLTIPSTVTSIGGSAFSSNYGMKEYHILPTTPPTLGTNAFQYIVSDCVIYVPAASLSAYQTAENWSAYASYMQGE